MKAIISNIDQVTPQWLTNCLRQHGILSQGQVQSIAAGDAQAAFGSAIWQLKVSYSKEASPNAPQQLYLKCSNPTLTPGEFDPKQLQKEIIFYQTIAAEMTVPFIIPVYSLEWDPGTGSSHLLMKDVSETHGPCPDPTQIQHCESAVDALAHFHAFWWDHPRLGKVIGQYPTPEKRKHNIAETIKATNTFMDELGEQLPRRWRSNYEQVLTGLPDLFKRHASGRNLTLAHGDAHLGNFLFSRDSQTPPAYLLDWQFWHPTIGGTDLAFMIATEWETETRRSLEQPLLQRYYRTLLTQGVSNYSFENCWDDYRLSVILVSIFIPVWRRVIFQWKSDLTTLDRCMTAFDDLKCRELLG